MHGFEHVCVSVCLIELDSERVTMDPSVDGSISEDIEYSSSSGDESSLEQPTFIFWLIFTIPSLTVRHYDFSHLRIEHGRLLYYTVKISQLQII